VSSLSVVASSYRRGLPDSTFRPWLARRIEREAWATVNAWHGNRQQCLGRVLGFLEIGVRLGYWSRKTADGVAESVPAGYGLRSVRRRLLR
jgi:hypothetical protein